MLDLWSHQTNMSDRDVSDKAQGKCSGKAWPLEEETETFCFLEERAGRTLN